MCGNVNSSSATVQYKCGNNVQNRNRHANWLNGRTHVVRVRAISAINYPIIKHHVCMHVKRCNSNTCNCTAANSKKKKENSNKKETCQSPLYCGTPSSGWFLEKTDCLKSKKDRLQYFSSLSLADRWILQICKFDRTCSSGAKLYNEVVQMSEVLAVVAVLAVRSCTMSSQRTDCNIPLVALLFLALCNSSFYHFVC